MADPVLFDFAVPDELLQEAVAKSSDPEVVAALDVMPGTGEGKAPPLLGILRLSGFAPLILLTAAALVPATFGNGISLIGTNLEHTFHIHDAALGAVTFVAAVAQLLWAVPTGPVGRPGQSQGGGRRGAADLLGLRPADGAVPQRVGLHLPLPDGVGRVRGQQHRAQLLSVGRLSHRGPRPGLQLAQPLRPAVPDRRLSWPSASWSPSPTAGATGCSSPWWGSPSVWPCSPSRSRTRGPTSPATS